MTSRTTTGAAILRAILPSSLAVLGVAAMIPASLAYGILHTTCETAVGAGTAARIATMNGAAFVVLAFSWYLSVRAAVARPGPRPILHALARALPAHALALFLQPFLSTDPAFYSAIGRVITTYNSSPARSLADSMAPNDPYFVVLSPFLRISHSVYAPGFHALCAAVALCTTTLSAAVHAHQAVACVAILATSAVLGHAARAASKSNPDVLRRTILEKLCSDGTAGPLSANSAAAVATALVASSPIAIVEASLSAHNDALMALFFALAVWALVRRRPVLALGLALPALLVKLSAFVVIGLLVGGLALVWLRRKVPPTRAKVTGGFVAVGLVVFIGLLFFGRTINGATAIFAGGFPHVTLRAPEAIPRILLYGLDEVRPVLGDQGRYYQWWVGVAFRCLGIPILTAVLARAYGDGRPLAWIGPGLLVFLAAALGSTHPWYQILVLPFLPFTDARWLRALIFGLVGIELTNVADLYLNVNCSWPLAGVWLPFAVSQVALASGVAIGLRVRDRAKSDSSLELSLQSFVSLLALCAAMTLVPIGLTFWSPLPTGRVLGAARVRGVSESGFYQAERTSKDRAFRWTNGDATLRVPLESHRPAFLHIDLFDANPYGASVELKVDGETIFVGPVPEQRWSETFELAPREAKAVNIEIHSSTFVPAEAFPESTDRRALGLQINAIQLQDHR